MAEQGTVNPWVEGSSPSRCAKSEMRKWRWLSVLLFILVMYMLTLMSACSKCYTCKTAYAVKDNNGNVIKYDTTTEDVCTADKSEIDAREKQGAVCTAS